MGILLFYEMKTKDRKQGVTIKGIVDYTNELITFSFSNVRADNCVLLRFSFLRLFKAEKI